MKSTFFCILEPLHEFLHLVEKDTFAFGGVCFFIPLEDGFFAQNVGCSQKARLPSYNRDAMLKKNSVWGRFWRGGKGVRSIFWTFMRTRIQISAWICVQNMLTTLAPRMCVCVCVYRRTAAQLQGSGVGGGHRIAVVC